MQNYNPEAQARLNKPAWTLQRVEDTTGPVGTSLGRVKRVYIRLFDGTDTYVDLPANQYTSQALEQAANAAATAHMDVVTAEAPTVGQLGQ